MTHTFLVTVTTTPRKGLDCVVCGHTTLDASYISRADGEVQHTQCEQPPVTKMLQDEIHSNLESVEREFDITAISVTPAASALELLAALKELLAATALVDDEYYDAIVHAERNAQAVVARAEGGTDGRR